MNPPSTDLGVNYLPELISGIYYCAVDCPYLKGEPESVNKRCTLTGKELDFYDWHLASCVEPERPAEIFVEINADLG